MKNSGFMKAMELVRRQDRRDMQFFTRQLVQDCCCIALNRAFGFGPERLLKFCKALHEASDEVYDMWNDDNRDREYTIAKLDESMKEICGEYFEPWETRYGGYYINKRGELCHREQQ